MTLAMALETKGAAAGDALSVQLGELTERAAQVIGLEERDLTVVASVRSATWEWAPVVAGTLARCLVASGELASKRTRALADLEPETVVWFHRLASGSSGRELWLETLFFGLTLAAWGVSAATTRAFLRRLDELLTLNTANAMPSAQALEVGAAFTRLLRVAEVVVSHAHRLADDVGAAKPQADVPTVGPGQDVL